jgi:large subunit ribosomal protein L25
MVALDPRLIVREMQRTGWRARLYQVKAGRVTERALMREIQLHPVSDKPLHVDFLRIAAGEPVTVAISVAFHGEEDSVGIKRGGVLNIEHHSIEVSVDPDDIPERFEADISGLDIGDVVRWGDLKNTADVTLLGGHDDDMVIATVAPPTIEEEPEPEAETEGAEGETSEDAESDDKDKEKPDEE